MPQKWIRVLSYKWSFEIIIFYAIELKKASNSYIKKSSPRKALKGLLKKRPQKRERQMVFEYSKNDYEKVFLKNVLNCERNLEMSPNRPSSMFMAQQTSKK